VAEIVPAEDIERIVGVDRHKTDHWFDSKWKVRRRKASPPTAKAGSPDVG